MYNRLHPYASPMYLGLSPSLTTFTLT